MPPRPSSATTRKRPAIMAPGTSSRAVAGDAGAGGNESVGSGSRAMRRVYTPAGPKTPRGGVTTHLPLRRNRAGTEQPSPQSLSRGAGAWKSESRLRRDGAQAASGTAGAHGRDGEGVLRPPPRDAGLVPPAGLEPAAWSLGKTCSIQLSYGGLRLPWYAVPR